MQKEELNQERKGDRVSKDQGKKPELLEEDGKRVTIVFKNHQWKVKLVSEGGSENVSATGS